MFKFHFALNEIPTQIRNEILTEKGNSHSNNIFKSHIKRISSYNSMSMTHLAQPQ